ncbi:hypothetical protein DCO46_06240 [Flavobacterium sp. HTF]|nr:hypothetical protein DCO46_06240 [Flavobacterium sp. HTF]
MMRNNYLCVLLFIIPFLAKAQLETYGRYTENGNIEPNINYSGAAKITDKISLTFFGLVEQKWSEALIGVKYSPTNTFSIGGSAGIEQGTNSPRYSASIWKLKGKTSLLVLGELGSGKDNYLYKVNLFHQYSDLFTFGLTGWRFHGVGPNFRFTVKKLSSTLWSMPAYDFESNTSKFMFGISYKM